MVILKKFDLNKLNYCRPTLMTKHASPIMRIELRIFSNIMKMFRKVQISRFRIKNGPSVKDLNHLNLKFSSKS